jgi:hypothetical protein
MIQKKASDSPRKQNDIKTWLNKLPNIHILRKNSTSRWVDFKTTHQLYGCTQNLHTPHPLAWANKKFTHKLITLSIQPTFDSLTPMHARKVFPQCLCRTEPIKFPYFADTTERGDRGVKAGLQTGWRQGDKERVKTAWQRQGEERVILQITLLDDLGLFLNCKILFCCCYHTLEFDLCDGWGCNSCCCG